MQSKTPSSNFERGKDIGLYIHIPFCPSKCHYCSFAVITDHSFYDQYLSELKKELEGTLQFAHEQNRTIRTIYFGGGTPSTLKKEDIKELINIISSHPERSASEVEGPVFEKSTKQRFPTSAMLRSTQPVTAEISFELNPEHVTAEYLADLKELGITRVSIGIQSLDEKVLQKAGRKHTKEQALEALSLLKQSGIPFNADLILGLPESSKESFISTLKEILTFNPSHISSYFLTIESGTPFQLLPEKEFMKEEAQLEIFEDMKSILLENHFNQYEISNWAKSGFESQHNLIYWRGIEYLGVGLGAGSYFGRERWSNVQNMNLYLKNKEKRNLKSIEKLSSKDIAETYLMTSLRLQEGINRHYTQSLLTTEDFNELEVKTKELTRQNLLKSTENGYKIQESKRFLHNYIMSQLL